MFLSLIVPCYRNVNYLKACCASILEQLEQDCELILISDEAEQSCLDYCVKLTQLRDNIHFFKQKHAGVSAARNRGLKEARGQYVWFIDSDDWIAPNALTRIKEVLKSTCTDMLLIDFCHWYGSSMPPERAERHIPEGQILTDHQKYLYEPNLIKSAFSSVCTSIFKREKIKELQFNQQIHYGEDALFAMQTYQKIENFYYLKTADWLYFYRINQQSATHRFTPKMYWDYKTIRMHCWDLMETYGLKSEEQKHCFARNFIHYSWGLVRLAIRDSRWSNFREVLQFAHTVSHDPFFIQMRSLIRRDWIPELEGIFVACSYFPLRLNGLMLACRLGWSGKKSYRELRAFLKGE